MTTSSLAPTTQERGVELCGRRVLYRLVTSRAAKRLRVRVGLRGVEVIRPAGRTVSDAHSFLVEHGPWVLDQLRRARRLRAALRPERLPAGQILFRGVPTRIRVDEARTRAHGNRVAVVNDEIVVLRGGQSTTAPSRSLESWLRERARDAIAAHLCVVTARLGQQPSRVYVMGQRTKWGNCSSQRNLSFNWRLILAPEFVLRYLVTHEAVHLAVPNHSAEFWLTVQSLCPETEKAKQWLRGRSSDLAVDLEVVCHT